MNEAALSNGSVTSENTDKPILVVLRHAPHGSSWLREGLDVALVAAAFGKSVTLLFMGDGIEALLTGQQAGALQQKGTHPTLDMLPMYDIENLLVDGESLSQRGVASSDLAWPASVVTADDLPRLFTDHAPIFNF